MDQKRTWVINYFLAYLAMMWSNLDHTVVTAAIRQWRRRCQLVCRLAVDILNIIFSHALSIYRLVD